MFDKVTQKLARKMGRSVQEVAAPVATQIQKQANNKVDLWSRVLRFGVLIFLFVDGTRRVVADPGKSDNSPNQIVINNYVDTSPQRYRQRQRHINDVGGTKKGG